MKFKALRTLREPKEFVHIETNSILKLMTFYTCDLPYPQPLTADLEGMKQYFSGYSHEHDSIGFDDVELGEFEMFEANTAGADIRNKLTPPLNLLALLKLYFKETDESKKYALARVMKKEMTRCEKSIKYISNLL
jgi:hypothetical protein